MKERPILFSAPMIKALLAGTKTQTRRLVKPQPETWSANPAFLRSKDDLLTLEQLALRSHYGLPGDRLWVRETWRTWEDPEDGADGVRYFADGSFRQIEDSAAAADLWLDDHKNGKHGDDWRPSIYMRRWASRITLEVTEVRVQRLQDISEEDAQAEGVSLIGDVGCPCEGPKDDPGPHLPGCRWSHLDVDPDHEPYRASFAVLWDAINGKRAAWATNPWLWCLSFRRLP